MLNVRWWTIEVTDNGTCSSKVKSHPPCFGLLSNTNPICFIFKPINVLQIKSYMSKRHDKNGVRLVTRGHIKADGQRSFFKGEWPLLFNPSRQALSQRLNYLLFTLKNTLNLCFKTCALSIGCLCFIVLI